MSLPGWQSVTSVTFVRLLSESSSTSCRAHPALLTWYLSHFWAFLDLCRTNLYSLVHKSPVFDFWFWFSRHSLCQGQSVCNVNLPALGFVFTHFYAFFHSVDVFEFISVFYICQPTDSAMSGLLLCCTLVIPSRKHHCSLFQITITFLYLIHLENISPACHP